MTGNPTPHAILAELRRNAVRTLAGHANARRENRRTVLADERHPLEYRRKTAAAVDAKALADLDADMAQVRESAKAARTLLRRDRVRELQPGSAAFQTRVSDARRDLLPILRSAGDGYHAKVEQLAAQAIELGDTATIEALRRSYGRFAESRGQAPIPDILEKLHDATGAPDVLDAGKALADLDAGLKNVELTYSHLRAELADPRGENTAPVVVDWNGATINRVDPAMPAHTRQAIESAVASGGRPE